MKSRTLFFLAGLLVSTVVQGATSTAGTGDGDTGDDQDLENTAVVERAKRSIRVELEGSEAFEFKNVRPVRDDEGLLVTCGEVAGRNSEGKRFGFDRFATMGHPESVYIEGRSSDFADIWQRYCTPSD